MRERERGLSLALLLVLRLLLLLLLSFTYVLAFAWCYVYCFCCCWWLLLLFLFHFIRLLLLIRCALKCDRSTLSAVCVCVCEYIRLRWDHSVPFFMRSLQEFLFYGYSFSFILHGQLGCLSSFLLNGLACARARVQEWRKIKKKERRKNRHKVYTTKYFWLIFFFCGQRCTQDI